jgi:hypothetical protein
MLVERKPLRDADEIKSFFSRRRDCGAAVLLGQNRSYSYQMMLKLDTVRAVLRPGRSYETQIFCHQRGLDT